MKNRIEQIQEFLKQGQAALITNDTNRLYFTNMPSSAGTFVVTKEKSFLLIDFRYFEKAVKTVKSSEVILCEKLFPQLNELFNSQKITTVLCEKSTLTVSAFERIKSNLESFNVTADESLSQKIENIRSIKSKEEINDIKLAQSLTDKTFNYILNRIKSGVSEKEIMLDMEFFIRKNGSEGTAFDFIVVSGVNSSLPHGVPSDKKIQKGDFVTMDFGAVVNGYRSDMTRTIAVGHVNEKQKLVYNTVLKAQEKALEVLGENVECRAVDKAARDYIESAGFGKCFGHGLGHSVGLDIHENPACNTRDKTPLQAGMIMTVEPGIYIENEFGVRIEDMVVITKNGYENLTKSPKELIII